MAAKNLKNTTSSPLAMPSGEVIPPNGGVARVARFEDVESNPVVKSWLEMGALEFTKDEVPEEPVGEDRPTRVANTEQDETDKVSEDIKSAARLTGQPPPGTTKKMVEQPKKK